MTQRIVGNFVPGRIASSTTIALGMFVGTSVHGNRFMLREGSEEALRQALAEGGVRLKVER
jgi:hypothetical protein